MLFGKITTECVVIGGGPAGSQAARRLREGGVDTVLIERDLLHNKPCGGGVPTTTFKEFNLPRELIKKKVEWIRIVSPSGKDVEIKLHGGSIAIVERKEFDSRLRDIASERGARIINGDFKGFIEMSDKGIISRVITDGNTLEIISRYAIVASGVNSGFIPGNGKIKKVFALTIKGIPLDYKRHGSEKCEFYLGSRYAERFYSWAFPSYGENISAGTGGFDPLKVKGMLEGFLLRNGLRIDGRSRGYWIPLWQYSKRILNPWKNVVVIGDAGGLVMPLSFEGIYYALSSGNMAAEAIISKRPHEYPEEWKKVFLKRFRVMKLLWSYFLRNDMMAEEMVELHRRPEIQEASMRLWLRKDKSYESLLIYIKLFKHVMGRYMSEILHR